MKATDIINQIKENKKNIEFLPTGFKKLDEFMDGGFMRKELIVIGGYTGVGKSFIASAIFYNIARGGFSSAYISLEISNAMVVSRIVGAISNIKPTRLIAGLLEKEDYERRLEAEAEVGAYDEFMNFEDELYAFEKIKTYILENQLDFVIVDFIQNIISPQSDEYSRLSFLAVEFQRMAKETNSCIVLLSQLSNAAAKGGLMEYKGSGSIQTVCDLGFFIERTVVEEYSQNNLFKLILRKNRRGISGKEFEFVFKQPGGKIYES